MTIKELRILPPFAIGRLGSAPEPLDNYTMEDDPEHPLGYRRIRGAETLIVDEKTGEIRETRVPDTIQFKQDGRIRPVAPFLEVFAVTADDAMEPLSLDLLSRYKLTPRSVSWRVIVANRKVVRRTGHARDLVRANTGWFSGHERRELEGHCRNFVAPDKFVSFGHVRYIKPNAKFPGIRLRFTPAQGSIYGPSVKDPYGSIPKERAIYDKRKAWYGFGDEDHPPENETVPPALYAIHPPAPSWNNNNVAVSRGYLDDACDGFVEVRLKLAGGRTLSATARVCAGPPALVPDALFVRNLADDLEQVLHGPHVRADEPYAVTRARAEDIVRRAYETVRFMNVTVMNGNDFKGRPSLSLDSMPEEEAADTERAIRPIMSPATVDTLAIMALHEQVFAALRGGAAPWFLRLLRKPDEVADFTDRGRRKMPALMCGADNSYLALTWRQIDTIRKVTEEALFQPEGTAVTPEPRTLTPRNLTAQLHYEAAGNPVSSRPVTSVANCCPGLEVDFRAAWRRMFKGIVLREYDNLVVDVEDPRMRHLKGHRLLCIWLPGHPKPVLVTTEIKGPASSDPDGEILQTTNANPAGVAPLEWSNALARVLHGFQGKRVRCDFTKKRSEERAAWSDHPPNYISVHFEVRHFFDERTAVISKALAAPGELTQGLCSPWQNDYRECSCYYWASARPDYVNVEAGSDGLSRGDNWLQKERTGSYVADDYVDERLILYDDLFRISKAPRYAGLPESTRPLEWEKWLRFQVGGKDHPDEEPR